MKKSIILIIILLIILALSAYIIIPDLTPKSEIVQSTEPSHEITQSEPQPCFQNQNEQKKYAGIYTDEDVLYKNDGITIINRWFDPVGTDIGPELKIYIINKSNSEYLFQVRELKVNDEYITPVFSKYVKAGESDLSAIGLLRSDLRTHKMTLINKLEFRFFLMPSNDMDNPYESDIITLYITD